MTGLDRPTWLALMASRSRLMAKPDMLGASLAELEQRAAWRSEVAPAAPLLAGGIPLTCLVTCRGAH
jgi:hypothetical protein